MLALLGVGQVIGDIPASSLANWLGDRHAMMVSAGLAVLAQVGCFFAGSLLALGGSLLVIGMANATFYLARQSYLIEVVPVRIRATAMSTLGGSHRIGLFIGPFVGAGAIALTGLRAAYVVAMVAATCAALLLYLVPDAARSADSPALVPRGGVNAVRVVVHYRRLFATLGLALVAVGAVRGARQTVLPLWAEHIGLSPETTSIVFGIASAVDMALFYPAGQVTDRFGRLSVSLPSMVILGAAMMTLPLTHNVVSLTIVAMIMSFGNGVGSGIIMTLGADISPADNRVRFLSVCRLLGDSGTAAGPVVVSVVAGVATLAAGLVAIGSVGLLAAAALARWTPRYSPFATPAMARAHRLRL